MKRELDLYRIIQIALPLVVLVSGPITNLMQAPAAPALTMSMGDHWNKVGDALFPFFDEGCMDEKRCIAGILELCALGMITGWSRRKLGYAMIMILYGRNALIYYRMDLEAWKYLFAGSTAAAAGLLLIQELEEDLAKFIKSCLGFSAASLEIVSTRNL